MNERPRQMKPALVEDVERLRLDIQGTVQGVGFRPFLYRLAKAHGLGGFALNSPEGVIVEIEGPAPALAQAVAEIEQRQPQNADISALRCQAMPAEGETGFRLVESARRGAGAVSVPADLATCDACLAEIFDPANRRYLYPFTNCVDCGPRYSLIEALPYDRSRTSMREFPMCGACQREYEDPANRRFHAEPNACPDCGPQIELWDGTGQRSADKGDALEGAAAAIRAGRIVAVKGIGGFHLICDARNEAAVAALRVRKQRPDKPFAVMFPTLADIKKACRISPEEDALLAGKERPIVLLEWQENSGVAGNVAPGNPCLGVMLPYTPLHHLLMAELGFPVVATSGNLSGEPLVTENEEALQRLGGIADCFLVHDRKIVRPVDDSVARIVCAQPMLLRRARGYAPGRLEAPGFTAGMLALGGHLKTSFAHSRNGEAAIGPHIGDLDSAESRTVFERGIEDLLALEGNAPRTVVCDLHPDYHTTAVAERMTKEPLRVQHHAAHIGAVMAEHGLEPPVLGIAWDGTGYGPDATIWGGEILLVGDSGWSRLGHLRTFSLPGGEQAMREPRRALFGLLHELFGDGISDYRTLPAFDGFSKQDWRILGAAIEQGINAPRTSSMGRLFDGVSALLGLCDLPSYEGQAACQVEWGALKGLDAPALPFPIEKARNGSLVLDWGPAIRAMLDGAADGTLVSHLAAGFHSGLAGAVAEIASSAGAQQVALSGGCFQNALLLDKTVGYLRENGNNVFWNQQVPPGDGGLALGQLWWAAVEQKKRSAPCA